MGHLWSQRVDAFDQKAREFVRALAEQAAIAVANAERYRLQLERNELLSLQTEQLSQIYNLSHMMRGDQPLEEMLEAVAHGIQDATDFNTVAVSLRQDETTFRRVAGAGIPLATLEEMKQTPVPVERIESLMIEDFRISDSYFLPGERRDEWNPGFTTYVPVKERRGDTAAYWHPNDSLLVLLRTTAGESIGYMTVDDPRSGLRPSQGDIQLLEIFASQAAFAVETARIYQDMADRADELEQSLTQLQGSYRQLDQASQTLRRKDEELSAVNQLLETRAARLLTLHRVTQVVAEVEHEDYSDMLQPIAGAIVDSMDVDLCAIAFYADGSEGLSLAAVAGLVPQGVVPDTIVSAGGPLDQSAGDGNFIVVDDIKSSAWADNPALSDFELHTFVSVPISVANERSGAILCASRHAWLSYGREDLDLFAILADQIGYLYTNARLLNIVHQEAESARLERDRLQNLHIVANRVQQARSIPERLQIIADGIYSSGWNRVVITMRSADMHETALITAGYTSEEQETLRQTMTPPEVWRARFEDPNFEDLRLGAAYYMRYNHPWMIENVWGGEVPEPTIIDDDWWHPSDTVLLPLYGSEGNIIGLIEMIEPTNGRRPTEDALQPIELFANQAASTVEMFRLYMESVRTADEEALLSEIMEAVTARLDVLEIAKSLARGMRVLVPYAQMDLALAAVNMTHFDVYHLREGELGELLVEGGSSLPMEGNAVSKALMEKDTTVYHTHPDIDLLPDLEALREQGMQTVMVTPLVVGQHAIGAITLSSDTPDTYSFEDNRFLIRRMANMATVALQNANLFQQVMDREHFASALSNLGIALNVALDLQEVVDIICRDSPQILNADDAFMWLVEGDELVGTSTCGLHQEAFAAMRQSLDSDASLAVEALRVGYPTFINNTADADYELAQQFGVVSAIAVPLTRENTPLGALVLVDYDDPIHFSEADAEKCSIFSVQVAIAIQNARLVENVRERAVQLEALTQVSQEMAALLDRESIINAMLAQLSRVVPFDSVALWLKTGDKLRVEAVRGFAEDQHLLGQTVDIQDSRLLAAIAERSEAMCVPDITQDPERFPGGAERPTRSWLGAPILSKGEVIGLLTLDKIESNFYNQQHEQLAFAFCNQAAVALENAHLFEEVGQRADELDRQAQHLAQLNKLSQQRADELDRQAQRLARLNRLSQRLAASLDLESAVQVAIEELAEALNAPQGGAILFDTDINKGVLTAEYPRRFEITSTTIPLKDNPVVEQVRETRQPIAIEDAQNDPLLAAMQDLITERNVQSTLIVPMVVGTQVLGILNLDSIDEPCTFTTEQQELAQTIAHQAAVAIQNAKSFEQTLQRTMELEMISESAAVLSGILDLDELNRTLAARMFQALGGDTCTVYFWDNVHQQLEVAYHQDRRTENLEESGQALLPLDLSEYPAMNKAIMERQPFAIYENDLDADTAEMARLEDQGMYGRLVIPLEVRDASIGLVEVQTADPDYLFSTSAVRLARTLASQGATAIDSARLQAETFASVERNYAQQEIIQRLSRVTTDLDEIYKVLRMYLPTLMGADSMYLALYDRDRQQLHYPLALRAGELETIKAHALGGDIPSWILKNRSELLPMGDIENFLHTYGITEWEEGLVAYCGVPVMTGEAIYGVLALRDFQDTYAFNISDQIALQAIASHISVTFEKADLLTDLAGRVQERTQELQSETAKSRAILEGVADGVMVADNTGTIILFNEAAELILSLARDEVLNRPIQTLSGVFGGAGTGWFQAIQDWANNPTNYEPGTYLEERLDLGKRFVSVHLSPVMMGEEFLGVVSVIRDITRDVEVDRLKSEFVSTVSHELRTPMTSIKGYADLLLIGAAGEVGDMQRKFLETIKSNADRLSVLVNDLLDISRIDQGRIKLNLGPLRLHDIVDDVLKHIQGRIENEEKGMQITHSIPEHLPPIRADQNRITQVVTNLVDNAFQYTPEDGKITITVEVDDADEYVVVRVADTGIGVAPEDLPRVFERFYRGEDPLVMETPGTGLGLAIVKEMVEMHGGTIDVTSELGKGTTFWFTLPVQREEDEAGSPADAKTEETESAAEAMN
jgi:PAS domain S-box-containing protein